MFPQKIGDWQASIHLSQMQFPNATLSKSWYRAKKPIHWLEFQLSRIDVIESDAFDWPPFRSLTDLAFVKCTPIEYKAGFLSGLPHLKVIAFENMQVNNVDATFLLSVRGTLESFLVESYTGHLDFNVVFGTYKFLQLHSLSFVECAAVRTLAYGNFTGLSALRRLNLQDNAIEVIEPGAFDYILVTLVSVTLTGNRLKMLPAEIFNIWLELDGFDNDGPFIELHDNPWSCECEMIEALHSIDIYRGNWARVTELHDICSDVSKHTIVADCPQLQVIDRRRLGANKTLYVAHAKLTLKLDQLHKVITLNTGMRHDIRLWIAEHDTRMQSNVRHPKCPKFDWLFHYSKCIRIPRAITRVPVHEFADSWLPFKTICINYVAADGMLAFWPLNCVTYRQFYEDDAGFWDLHTALIVIGTSFIGCSTGILLMVGYKWLRAHWMQSQLKSEPAKEDCAAASDTEEYYAYGCVRKDDDGYIIFDAEYEMVVAQSTHVHKCPSIAIVDAQKELTQL